MSDSSKSTMLALAGVLAMAHVASPLNLGGTEVTADRVHVWVLVGNSAMAGRDPDRDRQTHARAWKFVMYDSPEKSTWQPAREPLYEDKHNKGNLGGPGMPLLKALVDQLPETDYCAAIQMAYSAWTCRDELTRGRDEYEQLVDVLLKLKGTVHIAGLVSMFGLVEAQFGWQSRGDHATTYLEDISAMVQSFREDLGMPNLPYIHSAYPQEAQRDYAVTNSYPRMILAVDEQITTEIHNSAVIPTRGLTIYEDIYRSHYDRAGCLGWGERVADTIVTRGWAGSPLATQVGSVSFPRAAPYRLPASLSPSVGLGKHAGLRVQMGSRIFSIHGRLLPVGTAGRKNLLGAGSAARPDARKGGLR